MEGGGCRDWLPAIPRASCLVSNRQSLRLALFHPEIPRLAHTLIYTHCDLDSLQFIKLTDWHWLTERQTDSQRVDSQCYLRLVSSARLSPPHISFKHSNRIQQNTRRSSGSSPSSIQKSFRGLPSSFKHAVIPSDHSEEIAPRPTKVSAILRFRGT